MVGKSEGMIEWKSKEAWAGQRWIAVLTYALQRDPHVDNDGVSS